MDPRRFEEIVSSAIDTLPKEFKEALANIDVVVEESPTDDQLDYFADREGLPEEDNDFLLLGLYEGIPLDDRSTFSYSGVMPDKITLFRGEIKAFCHGNEKTMEDQIRRTLLHEVGHYFGIDDERLRELGY